MVRSPRAFMKIADSAVESPSMRWQKLQSTASRVSALRTRSPLSSSPAGPPIGPASAARPPSRAIATAAFAAQPPLTTKNPLACTLPSGCGNSSTRNTSSRTMMPAHKMRGAPLLRAAVSAKDIATVLDITADDVMRDSDRRRRGQASRMLAPEHCRQFVALEPAGVLQFLAIDHDGIGQRFGVAADHDGRRKRPRLRREIFDAADSDADFFQHFATHRFLDRFAGLRKAGKTRPHGRRETRRAAEHATLAGNRQHDD